MTVATTAPDVTLSTRMRSEISPGARLKSRSIGAGTLRAPPVSVGEKLSVAWPSKRVPQIQKYLIGDVRERRPDPGARRELRDEHRRLAHDGVYQELHVHPAQSLPDARRARETPGSSPAYGPQELSGVVTLPNRWGHQRLIGALLSTLPSRVPNSTRRSAKPVERPNVGRNELNVFKTRSRRSVFGRAHSRPARNSRLVGKAIVAVLYCVAIYAAVGALYAARIFWRPAPQREPDDRCMSIGLAILWPVTLYLDLTE